jgi:hypothetical protein
LYVLFLQHHIILSAYHHSVSSKVSFILDRCLYAYLNFFLVVLKYAHTVTVQLNNIINIIIVQVMVRYTS